MKFVDDIGVTFICRCPNIEKYAIKDAAYFKHLTSVSGAVLASTPDSLKDSHAKIVHELFYVMAKELNEQDPESAQRIKVLHVFANIAGAYRAITGRDALYFERITRQGAVIGLFNPGIRRIQRLRSEVMICRKSFEVPDPNWSEIKTWFVPVNDTATRRNILKK